MIRGKVVKAETFTRISIVQENGQTETVVRLGWRPDATLTGATFEGDVKAITGSGLEAQVGYKLTGAQRSLAHDDRDRLIVLQCALKVAGERLDSGIAPEWVIKEARTFAQWLLGDDPLGVPGAPVQPESLQSKSPDHAIPKPGTASVKPAGTNPHRRPAPEPPKPQTDAQANAEATTGAEAGAASAEPPEVQTSESYAKLFFAKFTEHANAQGWGGGARISEHLIPTVKRLFPDVKPPSYDRLTNEQLDALYTDLCTQS